jgi:magnesium chelatase accessory protein
VSLFDAIGAPAELDWARDGRRWPGFGESRFATTPGVRWRVETAGSGPVVWLLHGSAASAHSFRDLGRELATRFTVLAPDLPGHGFSRIQDARAANGAHGGRDGGLLSLDGLAGGIAALASELGSPPEMIVGHSAGAAVALRLQAMGCVGSGGVVSLNGALKPFPGAAGHVFPVLAKALSVNSAAIGLFAWRAGQPGVVERLIESTGSRIDSRGLEAYRTLLRSRGHLSSTLSMMSRWNLDALQPDLEDGHGALTLVAADRDLAVPPGVSETVSRMAPGRRLVRVPRLGHLAHEEAPDAMARLIFEAADHAGVA